MLMKNFALIGIGDRTNREGALRLQPCLSGVDEVALVHQPVHPLLGERNDPMVVMHLDTYFNVTSSGTVIGSELLMQRARVEVYHREGDEFKRADAASDLAGYIRGKGFDIIDITTLEQMAYAPNFLCIREGVLLAVEVDRVAKDVLVTLAAKADTAPEQYGALYDQAKRDYHKLRDEGQFFPHKKEVYRHDIDAPSRSVSGTSPGDTGQPTV